MIQTDANYRHLLETDPAARVVKEVRDELFGYTDTYKNYPDSEYPIREDTSEVLSGLEQLGVDILERKATEQEYCRVLNPTNPHPLILDAVDIIRELFQGRRQDIPERIYSFIGEMRNEMNHESEDSVNPLDLIYGRSVREVKEASGLMNKFYYE